MFTLEEIYQLLRLPEFYDWFQGPFCYHKYENSGTKEEVLEKIEEMIIASKKYAQWLLDNK